MQYNKAISTIRGIMGLSIQEFATKTGLSKSFISRIEKGERQPSKESITQVAEKLNIPEIFFHLLAREPSNEDTKNAHDIGKIMLELLRRNDK